MAFSLARGLFDAAIAHHTSGSLEDAARCCEQVLAIYPRHGDALNLLGLVAHQSGRQEEAVALLRRAIAADSKQAAYHANLGLIMHEHGRNSEAIPMLRRAVAIKHDFPAAQNGLGAALVATGRIEEAVACFGRALEIQPDLADAHNNLGSALHRLGRLDEAAESLRRAIKLRPAYAEAHHALGMVLRDQRHLDSARDHIERAIALRPDYGSASINLGAVLCEQTRLDDAIEVYRHAIGRQSCLADAHWNLALALLSRGDFAEGWDEHEWRWQTPQFASARREFVAPLWQGEQGEGGTLLLHAEQGYGDTIQFCRYATFAATRGWRVLLEVQSPLVRLMRSLRGVAQVVGRDEALPEFDRHCPLLSLPRAFATRGETIPGEVPYLAPIPSNTEAWAGRLAKLVGDRRTIGLCWAGIATLSTDRRRSMPFETMAALLDVDRLAFVNLRRDERVGASTAPVHPRLIEVMSDVSDFSDTAAVIANLDLVISVDTAVAHLAGALGRPVWLLDRFDSEWRWQRPRQDSPWYPTMRIYRQAAPGDWPAVIQRVAQDVAAGLPTADAVRSGA